MRVAAAAGMVGIALVASLSAATAQTGGGLQPFQMVRSLQLVQDRIANGDHAALPMQRKLLEMIDAKLRDGDSELLAEPRNYRAMLVYAMSGGNPNTIEAALARLEVDPENKGIGAGILNYLTGRPKEAQIALSTVDPMHAPPELGAFLALVKGSLVALEHPKSALALFDQARLLGPGTLVEEAALRRIVGICGTTADAERFVAASSQYVRSYLRSPYASQFADSFVSGIVALNASLGLERIEKIVAMMHAEQQQVIYLRIARRAAIDGLKELSAFASERAERKALGREQADPRALLYSSLASVTSGSIEEVQAKLDKIDRTKLSESDRRLLDAVRAIATEVTAEPPTPNRKAISPAVSDAKPALAPVAGSDPARAGGVLVAAPRENPGAETAKAAETAAAPDPADALVAEARKKLEDIDKLLGEAAK